MRILRANQYRCMPWKNGGGVTREVAAWPPEARLDDFGWRVSMARVERDGPFSTFPSVDRTLTVLSGEGMILSVEGRIPFSLTLRSEPLPFPADVPAGARLIDGPLTDLNVMTRRGSFVHAVRRLSVSGQAEISSDADTVLLICHDGPLEVTTAGEHARLAPLDCVLLNNPATRLSVSGEDTTIFLIEIRSIG